MLEHVSGLYIKVLLIRGVSRGGLRGLQPPAAPKYLSFSDRELRFEKNLTVLAPILTEIRFFKLYNLIIRNNALIFIQRKDLICKKCPFILSHLIESCLLKGKLSWLWTALPAMMSVILYFILCRKWYATCGNKH